MKLFAALTERFHVVHVRSDRYAVASVKSQTASIRTKQA
jgi:hypothetical protein